MGAYNLGINKGRVKTVTVALLSSGKYFASVLTDDGREAPQELSHIDTMVGIDLGITDFCASSTGAKTANPRFLERASKNLRRKQKKLSRCKKGSRRRHRARLRVANARTDFQQKLANALAGENQAVGVETLRIKNMMKNRRLLRVIGNATWSNFTGMLEYKLKERGKRLVKIDAFFASSKTCSACNHVVDALPLSRRRWTCPACGACHDRDVNAAMNIQAQAILRLKADGCTVSARGGMRKTFRYGKRRPVKREAPSFR